MLNSIFSRLTHGNLSLVRVISYTQKPCLLQLHQISSSASASASANAKNSSFTVNYLMETFGFSQEKALSASNYVKIDSKDKPDSVIALLKSHGFSTEQISTCVRRFPYVIVCDPRKTLLPKIKYFRSLGIPEAKVINIFVSQPSLFRRSLEKKIIPAFNYVKGLFDSSNVVLGSMNILPHILRCNFQLQLRPNVDTLREVGVPDQKIVVLLQYQPRIFMVSNEKFREVVLEVKKIGFKPSEFKFMAAIHALRSMSKSTWDKKLAVYRKWGWSEDEIVMAFERSPYCMVVSTDKIMKILDFLVNEMGFDSSHVVLRPGILSYSLEKRMKPRSLVYLKLLENGLIKKGVNFFSAMRCTEEAFLKNYVHRYEEAAPGLLKLYQKRLAILEN